MSNERGFKDEDDDKAKNRFLNPFVYNTLFIQIGIKLTLLLMFRFSKCDLISTLMQAEHLPAPVTLHQEIPLSNPCFERIESYRETIKKIIARQDPRILLVLGPCSIHDLESTYAYAELFKKLSQEVSDHFFLVMRTYFEKPRTALGWKGFLNDPFLDSSFDIETGIRLTRKLLIDLAEMGIPTGSELLELSTVPYFADLLSWGCIGARTCTSQPHRQLASIQPFPIGFKNTTDGNVENALNGILSASSPQCFLSFHSSGKLVRCHTKGNLYCHVVLRGGESGPNYQPHSIKEVIQKCTLTGVDSKIMIDCSHDNCGKRPERQIPIFESVIQQITEGNQEIFGAMIESHLFGGNQPFTPYPRYGISLTDPCLGWQATEVLVKNASLTLQNAACLFS